MNSRKIAISLLRQNTGQIPGLPANPRTWTQQAIDQLAVSIKETPELFDARPIVVYPQGDYFVILAGNLRYDACRQIGLKTVPCIVLPPDCPVTTLGQIVLKDNGEFGSWNAGLLANDWADLPLEQWGVDTPKFEDFSGKNQEIDPGKFSENIVLKLKYREPTATLVLARLGKDKAQTLLSALHYGN